MKRLMFAAAFGAASATLAFAQASAVKIGFISTFSGPNGILGQELLDGFKLGLKSTGGTIGGRAVELIEGDDQAKPDVGRQLADKMIESNRVQIITGPVFSSIMLALAKPVLDAGAFVLSINAGPSQYAGKQCNPRYFSISFQNDTPSEAMGLYLNTTSVKRIYLMAPNYPAGKDFLAGFKRTFKGEIADEVYTGFGQLDYAAEIAQLRAKKPDAVFFFYPGGMGINFVKQYAQAGLKSQVPLFSTSGSLDQTVLPAMGDAALNIFTAGFWSETTDNAVSHAFVAEFVDSYKRIPSSYAAVAYDGARALDAAAKAVGGKIEDKAAFQKALENVVFESVRGKFRFNFNHYPVQDFYLTENVKDDKGRIAIAQRGLIDADHADAYVGDCKMAAAAK